MGIIGIWTKLEKGEWIMMGGSHSRFIANVAGKLPILSPPINLIFVFIPFNLFEPICFIPMGYGNACSPFF